MPKIKMSLEQRMCQHMHNSLKGRLANAQQALFSIGESPTATPQAKTLANQLANEIHNLFALMDFRVNVDGSTTKVQSWHKGKPIRLYQEEEA